MSESDLSYNDFLDNLLSEVLKQLNRYVAVIIFLFGVVGNILNILVLSQKFFRFNSCAWLFLVSSIINLISILCGLTTRILSGWIVDPTSYIGWACKLRALIVFATRTMSPWLFALATIDRWLLSSIDANRRRRSNLKNAQRGAIAIIISSILLYTQMLYCYDITDGNTPLPCYGKTLACQHLTDFSLILITILCPLFFMVVFGLLTISNVHRSQLRVQTHPVKSTVNAGNNSSGAVIRNSEKKLKQKNDRNLLRMLLVQVLLLIILTLPLAVSKIYSTTAGDDASETDAIISSFVYQLCILIYFISNGLPFYVYTLCGGTMFRKALYDLLLSMKRKLMYR